MHSDVFLIGGPPRGELILVIHRSSRLTIRGESGDRTAWTIIPVKTHTVGVGKVRG